MFKALSYRGPALAHLHENYAKRHHVDANAPLVAGAEAVVVAPVARVWQKLSDVPAWATNLEAGVRNIDVPDGVVSDAWFWRTASGARMRARFAVVEPQRELAWSGAALGLRVVHRFVLEPLDELSTLVTTHESMAGPPLAALFTEAKLRGVLESSLRTLKAACEATAG